MYWNSETGIKIDPRKTEPLADGTTEEVCAVAASPPSSLDTGCAPSWPSVQGALSEQQVTRRQAGQKLRHRHARRRVNPGVALLPPQDQRPERRQPRRHPRDGHAPLGPQAVLAQVEVTQLQERPEAGRDRGRSIVAKPVLAAGTA